MFVRLSLQQCVSRKGLDIGDLNSLLAWSNVVGVGRQDVEFGKTLREQEQWAADPFPVYPNMIDNILTYTNSRPVRTCCHRSRMNDEINCGSFRLEIIGYLSQLIPALNLKTFGTDIEFPICRDLFERVFANESQPG